MNINIKDFEIFKYHENEFTDFMNDGKIYSVNKHPYLDIVLNDHCNQNCSFCIADLIHEKLTLRLGLAQEKILFAIRELGVKDVLLLGGEPTLYRNLIRMINWMSGLGLDKIIMTTNGKRLGKDEKFRTKVLQSGITDINISVMSFDDDQAKKISGSDNPVTYAELNDIYLEALENNVKIRINTNIFKNNNDTVDAMSDFYLAASSISHSIKFSPLFEVDKFSVLDVKTEWTKKNVLDHKYLENFFTQYEEDVSDAFEVAIIVNDLQFGFVKNTLIPLDIPIIMNWNFGKHTGMIEKVLNHNQINNVKLLPNGELSLSWNREYEQYYIKTD